MYQIARPVLDLFFTGLKVFELGGVNVGSLHSARHDIPHNGTYVHCTLYIVQVLYNVCIASNRIPALPGITPPPHPPCGAGGAIKRNFTRS